MKYAVIDVKGKQYKVSEGDVIDVERLEKEAEAKITLGQVMLFGDSKNLEVGKPYLKDVKVEAKVLGEKKTPKIIVYKHKRRKDYKKKTGHRQILTSLKILKIKTK